MASLISYISNGHSSQNTMNSMQFTSTSGDDNPLLVFVSAKKDINSIITKTEHFFTNLHEFNRSFGDDYGEFNVQIRQIENSIEKLIKIKDALARNNMKVAFFGRTSNGKSTVINAILQNNILPSGIGHTTNCFLQVEGTDEEEPYIVVEQTNQRYNIDSVKHLANALSTESLEDSALVKIHWPKSKCPILHDDVVLVDSPGTDVSANLDKWIDLYCRDADVFVLVSNSESTLMQTEKNFFIQVKNKLSNPNVFILNNRWDASAQEPESLDLVRNQHMTRDLEFLVNDLNVVDEETAKNRIFFVSAREILNIRMKNAKNEAINKANYADGFENRFVEFMDFEKKFEKCLSKSAVETKFLKHTQEVMKMTKEMKLLLEDLSVKTITLKQTKTSQIKALRDRGNFVRQQFQIFTNEVKHEITNLVKQVEQRVSTALNEEIRRLALLVSDFDKPFGTDEISLANYKKDLHSHVEKGLGSNLATRLSTALSCNVEKTQKQMIEGVQRFVPEAGTSINNMSPQHQFKLVYRLNCDSLCSDFQEDLEFRFSYGFMQLLNYLLRSNDTKQQEATANGKPGQTSVVSYAADKLDLLDRISRSRANIATLAAGGFLVRIVGWQVIAITSAIYALLYIYERVSWTTRAKEDSFKKQYVAHATRKLKLIIDLTSSNCSYQVQQ